jgi:hypothetical protein
MGKKATLQFQVGDGGLLKAAQEASSASTSVNWPLHHIKG